MFDRFKNFVWAGVALGALAASLPAAAQDAEGGDRRERNQGNARVASTAQETGQMDRRASQPRMADIARRERGAEGEDRVYRARGNPSRGMAAPAAAPVQVQTPVQVQAPSRGNRNRDDSSGTYVSAPRDRSYGAYTRDTNRGGNRGERASGAEVRSDTATAPTGRWVRGDRRDGDRNRTDGWRGDRGDGWRNERREEARRDERRDDARNYNRGYRDGYRADSRYGSSHRNWDRNRWRSDNRYDWYRYRAANRSVFHLGRYYAPYRNYSYSRISIGFRLGSLFYSNRYWIADPWRYRLPDVYGPYRWVRYYDDALLVDIYSGEVVDVINDFFW